MKKKQLNQKLFLHRVYGLHLQSTKISNWRFFIISLFLFSTGFTVTNGQTVNYEYDTNGNVISKKVIQPLNVTSYKVKQDSIPTFSNFLAFYSPFKANTYTIFNSITPEKEVNKNFYEVNDKSSKSKTNVPLPDGNECYMAVTDKKKN